MKNLRLTIVACILFISLKGFSQIEFSKDTPLVWSAQRTDTGYHAYTVIIRDSTLKTVLLAHDNGKIEIGTDTIGAIKEVIKLLIQDSKGYQKLAKKYYALVEVVNSIGNTKKFNAALTEFKKLPEY